MRADQPRTQLPPPAVAPGTYAVAVCSGHTDPSMPPKLEQVFANHRAYAARHNYTYILQTDPFPEAAGKATGKYWTKLHLLRRLLRPPHRYDWVLWVDSDAVFVNMEWSVERLLALPGVQLSPTAAEGTAAGQADRGRPPTSFIFSGDTNAINTGVLLVRSTDYARTAVDEVCRLGTVMETAGITIAMGSDNAAFSVFLGGCAGEKATRSDPYQRCFDRVNLGFNQATMREVKEVRGVAHAVHAAAALR